MKKINVKMTSSHSDQSFIFYSHFHFVVLTFDIKQSSQSAINKNKIILQLHLRSKKMAV
jgi:hypothetical protein